MLHRIRFALANGSLEKLGGSGGGPVEADETLIGPNPRKMHRDRRARVMAENPLKPKLAGKTVVHGLLDRELREVRAKVIPNMRREAIQEAVLSQVAPSARLYTDESQAYDSLGNVYIHEVVNHSQEYVRGEVSTQGLENFWSLLKRTLRGTYVAVEPFHLDRYLSEQVFRYNNRATKDNPLTDYDRFMLALSQISGKRLTYAELTGKVGETAS
jgi:transposase-like protein